MSDDPIPYDPRPKYDAAVDVPSLAHVWLDERSVVSVDRDGDDLRLLLEAVLLPGHPEYREPPPTEWACYRWAYLVFDHPEEIELRHPLGAAGQSVEADYGEIYALRHDGEWVELHDDGVIRVRGGTVRFELQPPDWTPTLEALASPGP